MSYSLTVVESPYAGDVEANLEYARAACLDCIRREENPFASHLFYPQFLHDDDPDERDLGIKSGYEWGIAAAFARKAPLFPIEIKVAFYVDKGWSAGMEAALTHYTRNRLPCEIRRLDPAAAPNGSAHPSPPVEERA
jgi:hypothetical protein